MRKTWIPRYDLFEFPRSDLGALTLFFNLLLKIINLDYNIINAISSPTIFGDRR
jgi:hypothetical protein